VSADAAAAAPAAPAAAPAVPAVFDFGGNAPAADPAQVILDEVLSGGDSAAADAPDEGAAADAPTEGAPAEPKADAPKPEAKETPPESLDAVRLRKGFAKLADQQQKVVERENAARAQVQSAQQWREKAQKHDELVASIENDPAAFLHAHGGDALIKKALEGFIAMEKSPAEREMAKFRDEQKKRDEDNLRREHERVATEWRNGIIAKVQADERFDLVNSMGLHSRVIDVISGYYEKHSERDEKGNVTRPALLPWEMAAEAVENVEAAKLDKSKRYGKRAPAASTPAQPAPKDAPSAKTSPAPAKKAPTSLSSLPVAETPSPKDDGPTDPDEREAWLLKEFGLS
jgi:hypothetical protein